MELLNELAKNGVLAIVLSISLAANLLLFRALIKVYELLIGSYDKRIADSKETSDKLIEPLKGVSHTVDTILSILNSAKKKNG